MFKTLIKEICEEENIKLTFLSKDWVMALEKNGICKLITGYKFDLNAHALGEVIDDKYAFYELLNHFSIPVITHHIVYSPKVLEDYALGCNSFSYVKELFYKYNQDVVLKINHGTCGIGVYHITNENDLEECYLKIIDKHTSLSLCPFYDIENEYRAVILNDNVELLYKKEKPVVIGDGKSTIYELLKNFNYEYFKKINDKSLDKILGLNEEYVYNWKFNLSGGARASFLVDDSIKEKVISLACETAKKIGLVFGSIDIIKTKDNHYYILEANSGVMMANLMMENSNGKDIAKTIYKKAINSLFEN